MLIHYRVNIEVIAMSAILNSHRVLDMNAKIMHVQDADKITIDIINKTSVILRQK